jgi:hypothetical protein
MKARGLEIIRTKKSFARCREGETEWPHNQKNAHGFIGDRTQANDERVNQISEW